MARLKNRDRIERIARALGKTPRAETWMRVSFRSGIRRWWLVGLDEGDVPLPKTETCLTMMEALAVTESQVVPLDSKIQQNAEGD